MPVIQRAKGVLADAEKVLRELMQEELASQRYSELAELAKMADGLLRLAGGATAHPTWQPRSDALSPLEDAATTTAARTRKASVKPVFPRFERHADKLVKVGWSKRQRKEYEHRAPRAAILAFTVHLGSRTMASKPFVVDTLLPAYDAAGDEIPNYQVYLALGWLRQLRIIIKRGREGYLRTANPLDGSVFDTLWLQTPERT